MRAAADRDDDHGSATIWTAALLGLLFSLTSAVLLLVTAIGARHSAERAADGAALAAAQAAMAGLRVNGDPQAGEPCTAAAQVAAASHVALRACDCDVLDCVVTVEGSLLDGLGLGERADRAGLEALVGGRIPVRATAQAGPVGESGVAPVESGQGQGVG
jgi:secretion/DNA translocation related TadE-like protein